MADMGPLRLLFYGFKNFCADFSAAHPAYTIYPVRLNWSAVETFSSRSSMPPPGTYLKLTIYASARDSIITRGSIHGKLQQHCGDYRDAPLFIRQDELRKKEIQRIKKVTLFM